MELLISLFIENDRKLFHSQLKRIFYCICKYVFSSHLLDLMELFYHQQYKLLLHMQLIKIQHMFQKIMRLSILDFCCIIHIFNIESENFHSNLSNSITKSLNVNQLVAFFDPSHVIVQLHQAIFVFLFYPLNKIYISRHQ